MGSTSSTKPASPTDQPKRFCQTGTASSLNEPSKVRGRRSAATVTAVDLHARITENDIVLGTFGDHPAIHQMLMDVFRGPSLGEFFSLGEEPTYEPSNRLLIKHGDRVLAHAHLTTRQIEFGSTQVSTFHVQHLGAVCEHRSQGLATALLRSIDLQLKNQRATFATIRATEPLFMRRSGWVPVGRHSFSRANTRAILAQLECEHVPETCLPWQTPQQPLNVRLWRHVEADALAKLYDENAAARSGRMVRDCDYWRWLIGRHGYDRIYVAIEGPDDFHLGECTKKIVGYAVMRQGRIVEMLCASRAPDAMRSLLQRACRDAIEQDHETVQFDAPPDHPLHEVLQSAGGKFYNHELAAGQATMLKVPNLPAAVAAFSVELLDRAKRASLKRPDELGFRIGEKSYQLTLTQRGVRLRPGSAGRHNVTCEESTFVQMLFGHFDLDTCLAANRAQVSSKKALLFGRALFEQRDIVWPVWDDLPG